MKGRAAAFGIVLVALLYMLAGEVAFRRQHASTLSSGNLCVTYGVSWFGISIAKQWKPRTFLDRNGHAWHYCPDEDYPPGVDPRSDVGLLQQYPGDQP